MPHIFLVSLLCARAPRPRGPHGSGGVRRPLSSSIGAQLPAPCSSSLLAPRYPQTSRNARACGVAGLTAFSLELPPDLSVQAPLPLLHSQLPGARPLRFSCSGTREGTHRNAQLTTPVLGLLESQSQGWPRSRNCNKPLGCCSRPPGLGTIIVRGGIRDAL